jgi:ubiquinone/menaquinone biosynthesis C-methylase UbiE
MAALDKIRLTGLLRESPASAGLSYWRKPGAAWFQRPPGVSTPRGGQYAACSVASDIRHPLFARFFDRLSRVMEPELGRRRDELLAGLSGRVLEVGAGNGINFSHYPSSVEKVVAIEPEPYMRAKAQRAAEAAAVAVTIQPGVAESLEFETASFDAVVACLVLCSVTAPSRALAELFRVLKPGGELRFFEHVRSERPVKARLQSLADRSHVWPWLGGGCHCSRDMIQDITTAGFRVAQREPLNVGPAWGVTNPHVLGRAVRPSADG